jgi:hypothetical protein
VHPRVVRRAAGGQGLTGPSAQLRRTWKALAAIPDLELGADVFGEDGDPAYWVNAKQTVNMVGEHGLAIRLTRKVISQHRARLKADERVEIRGSSDWVGLLVTKPADTALALELTELAAAVYRPTDGSPCKPPPEGADLDRRRRFH